MNQTRIVTGEVYNVFASTEKCINCKFQCKIIVDEKKEINLSCKHPKGPGGPVHCIYFKRMNDKNNEIA